MASNYISSSRTLFDPYGIPSEILDKPRPLIGFIGLKITENSTHKAIWDTFNSNRHADRPSMKLKLLSLPLELPVSKQKRQSYEWYTPKGILKQNWFKKYQNDIPSLFVMFWDLDWNSPFWQEEKDKAVEKIKELRAVVGIRGCRVAIVLIQNSACVNLPMDDSGGAAEKASTLCSECDVPSKHLFALPFSDVHLLGYVVRLENALSEIAGGFYIGQTKLIKGHRETLNKTNHQLLFIRHQIKLGFYQEIRDDLQSAIKHYAQAYHLLIELRCTDTNLHEVRTAASIVNCKLCHLSFLLNCPRDAIEQFRKHTENFHQKTGPNELMFEHFAWLSNQYAMFGSGFDDAVKAGLPAVQTQHPGFYFQLAAHFAIKRRDLAEKFLEDSSNLAGNSADAVKNLMVEWEKLEFFGQRPWRAGKHTLEPPEEQAEQEAVKLLCCNEAQEVNFSAYIISFHSSAISQFKKFRCPRMQRHLMVKLAKEYQRADDSAKGLALLNHVMHEYRQEKWHSLLSYCLPLALQCAYVIANIGDYCLIALELMGNFTTDHLNEDEKRRVKENLFTVMQGNCPDPEPAIINANPMLASHAWSSAYQSIGRSNLMLNVSDIHSCIQVKASWISSAVKLSEEGKISVKLKNTYIEPLNVFSISVTTSSKTQSELSIVGDFTLPVSDITEHFLKFDPQVEDIECSVKITSVIVQFGLSPDHSFNLYWASGGTKVDASEEIDKKESKIVGITVDAFESSPMLLEMEVISFDPKVQLEEIYDSDALVWEWLPIELSLINKEESTLTGLTVSLSLAKKSDTNLERTTQMTTQKKLKEQMSSHLGSTSLNDETLDDMKSGQKSTFKLYIKSLTAVKRHFTLKLSYSCSIRKGDRLVNCPFFIKKDIIITPKIPFQITSESRSMQFVPHTSFVPREKFLIVSKINCSSHVKIALLGSSITPGKNLLMHASSGSQVKNVELGNSDIATDCFCLSLSDTAIVEANVPLGQYMLYWRRAASNSSINTISPVAVGAPPAPEVSVSIGLPSITVEDMGLWVETKIPPTPAIRSPMTVEYNITNTSEYLKEISASMQVSDAFMFSGHKEIRLRLLAKGSETLTYTLFPLQAGYVQLPKLCLAIDTPTIGAHINAEPFLKRILQTHVFVMPQQKLSTDASKNQPSENSTDKQLWANV